MNDEARGTIPLIFKCGGHATRIRRLAATDCAAVAHLLRETGNFSDAEITIAHELMEIVVNQPQQIQYHAFVAEADEHDGPRVAGFLVLGPTQATVGAWDLYWIAVSPAFYGTGVAQLLDTHAEELVRERNGYWLIVYTSGQPRYERSLAFYRKQGYESLARVADYYAPGDDMIIFGKRLDKKPKHCIQSIGSAMGTIHIDKSGSLA